MAQQEKAPPRFTLTPVDARDSGALAYVMSRDGKALGLVMTYVMEGPGTWYGFARPSARDHLAQLTGSPFEDLEAAVRAVRDALTEDPGWMALGKSVAA